MNQDHPEELLAGYVDGALGTKERAVVDAHLASCARCREEVELAGSARTALRGLPEAKVPLGVTGPVLRRVRVERPWVSRIGRPVAVAAAAAVVGLFGWLGYSALRDDDPGAAGAQETSEADAAGDQAPAGPQAEATAAGVPVVEEDRDYDEAAVQELAALIAREQTYRIDAGDRREEAAMLAANEALDCIGRGAELTQGDEAVRVIDARFRGRSAYLGAFLHRASPGTDPTQLEIWVVAQDGCGFLHYAKQRL
jgi:hypothetical protein